MKDRSAGRRGERGFALVLAILSLMLLTFLGLTLATTTSTELQIATNFRWSQQALYNAEAGLAAARIALSNAADAATGWEDLLPDPRTTSWVDGSAPGPVETPAGRDFEDASGYAPGDAGFCDDRGGVGYGLVLRDTDGTLLQDVSSFPQVAAASPGVLNGAFTVWIRRPLEVDDSGQLSEDPANRTSLVIVSEGVAPYQGAATGFTRSRQAVRVLETRFGLVAEADPCRRQGGQEGMSPTGENFNPCAPITSGEDGSLGAVFGGAGAGGLEGETDVDGEAVR